MNEKIKCIECGKKNIEYEDKGKGYKQLPVCEPCFTSVTNKIIQLVKNSRDKQ
jgi:hypothetical protein